MTKVATTVFVFALYLLGLGAAMVLVPNTLLGLFRVPPTVEVWVRVAGMLVGFLGVYYVVAARNELVTFMRWTVPVRASVLLFFAAFVAARLAPPVLLAFGVVDLLGAIWTWTALRSPAGQTPSSASERQAAANPG